MKRARGRWSKVKSLLRMLLVCIRSYLKSVLIFKFLILDTYHPDALYLREQGCEDLWLFFEAERGPRAKPLGKHCSRLYAMILGATHTNLSRWGRDKLICCQVASYVIFDKNVCKCRSQPVHTLVPCLATAPLAHIHWRNRLLRKAGGPPEYIYIYIFFFSCGTAAQRGPWPPRSWGTHDAPQSVGLRRRDLYLTTHNTPRNKHSCPRWDSNLRSQQASGRWDRS
jgi:hypothetical protein